MRHYEEVGLLSPERPEIATIVDMYDEQPGEVGQLEYLLDEVERRCREDLDRLGAGAGTGSRAGGADSPGRP